MIVRIDKSFQKDIDKIKDVKVKHSLLGLIKSIQASESLSDVINLKKLTGYKDLFRIRLGNYRIGFKYTDDKEIILIRFLHRKEIYHKWP